MSSPNYLEQAGAEILAKRIIRYWREQGYKGIHAFAMPVHLHGFDPREHVRRQVWIIRSNIGPLGYPPKHAAAGVMA